MVGAPSGSKRVFTILFHRRSPVRFKMDWEARYHRQHPSPASEEVDWRNRDYFASTNPTEHRYNDIAGFAEVYWDTGTRLLIDVYFRGDRRTKYGRSVALHRRGRVSANHYYLYAWGIEVGFVAPSRHERRDRQALVDALQNIREIAGNLGCHVDLEHEEMMLESLDFGLLFRRTTANTKSEERL